MNPFRRSRPSRPGLRPVELVFTVAIVLGAAGGFATGCDPNALSPLLVPTGGAGAGPCTSELATIQMTGDFLSPPFDIPTAPLMELVRLNGTCVWRVTLQLNAGPVLFKFLTDGNFDKTPDFGGDEAVTLDVPGGPYATERVTGTGTAIKINVAAAGAYTFILDERALTWSAFPPPGGSIEGTVSFANLSSAPFPSARVEAFSGATSAAVVTTDPNTRAFSLAGLDGGTYRVVVSASCFATRELPSVTVAGGVNDVGDVALSEGASSSTTIDLVGGFNNFTPGADPMVESPPCVWTRERFVNTGVYFMKFFIDAQPEPSYGGDGSVVIPIPGGGPVQRFETGGTSVQIQVANEGVYRFTLDERLQQWSAVLVTPAPARGEER